MSEKIFSYEPSQAVELSTGETLDLSRVPMTGPGTGYPEPMGDTVYAGLDSSCGMDVNVTREKDGRYLKQVAA